MGHYVSQMFRGELRLVTRHHILFFMVKQWFALPGVCRTTVRDPNLQTVLLFISQHDDHADHIGPEQLLSQFRTILVRRAPPFVISFQPHNMVELRAIYRLDPIL